MIALSNSLKEKYDNYYSDTTEVWRRIGAVNKVENITELTNGLNVKNLIEIGAGDGNILSLLSSKNFCNELSAVEISSSAIEQINKKKISGLCDLIKFDGYCLPFETKQFDLLICTHVIEHVEHPRVLLREMKRISNYQFFEVPIDFSFAVDKKFDHFNSYGHINIYTPALFKFLLYSEEFKILKSKNALYNMEVIRFLNKNKPMRYTITMIKRLLWRTIPFLMKIKPNTYSVLTE